MSRSWIVYWNLLIKFCVINFLHVIIEHEDVVSICLVMANAKVSRVLIVHLDLDISPVVIFY